jgi:hypothetical protein
LGPGGFSARGILDVTIIDPNGAIVAESFPTFTMVPAITVLAGQTKTVSGTGSDLGETGNIDVATGDVTTSWGSAGILTNSQIFATYVGSGNIAFNVNVSSLASLGVGLPNQVFISNNTEQLTSGSASVTYTYSYDQEVLALPEPATFALLGSALLALGLRRKRRV